MSVFSFNDGGRDPYFESGPYFGSGEVVNLRHYTKKINAILFKWLKEVNNTMPFANMVKHHSGLHRDLKDCILKATRELLYNTIRHFGNLVDIQRLQGIGVVCYAIAYKLLCSHDYELFPGFAFLADLTANTYTPEQLRQLEVFILQLSDWQPCWAVDRGESQFPAS